ncbi:MAG: prepilin-type N-terminal cleavage/methylation domain-containing protein [Oscillospiraceae bacterium]|nr:prepilin-type N-terminal cleavage/methylation domain-containing protein [Oscillospiraceae bacterium]
MLKKYKSKSGFALVECIIAIAVFTIMSLMIAMLINASIQTHRSNIEENRSIKSQKKDISRSGTNVVNRATSGEMIVIEFDGISDPVAYKFDARISSKKSGKGGLELTEYFTDVSSIDRQEIGAERTTAFSLSKNVKDAIVTKRTAGIAVKSPDKNVLPNKVTAKWGGQICNETHGLATDICNINGVCTTSWVLGTPEVATKKLFAYRIPDDNAITDINNLPALVMGTVKSATYDDWRLNKGDMSLRGSLPLGVPLYANMLQIAVNKEINPCCNVVGCTTHKPDQIILHIPTVVKGGGNVVGIVVSDNIKDLVWLETVKDYTPNRDYPGTGVKYPGPAPSGGPLFQGTANERYDIIMERPPGQKKFNVYNIAIITTDHISVSGDGGITNPSRGNLDFWLNLGEYVCQKCASIHDWDAAC